MPTLVSTLSFVIPSEAEGSAVSLYLDARLRKRTADPSASLLMNKK
jgi:hypothetical protein